MLAYSSKCRLEGRPDHSTLISDTASCGNVKREGSNGNPAGPLRHHVYQPITALICIDPLLLEVLVARGLSLGMLSLHAFAVLMLLPRCLCRILVDES